MDIPDSAEDIFLGIIAGLSIVRPVRPGGHPGQDGVNRAERSEDYSLPGSRDEDGYPTGPGMDSDSVAEWLSG